jgi:hypothetical protein
MPEVDMEKYKDYAAHMQKKYEEKKYYDGFRAKYQARKDAKIARERALKTEPSTFEQPMSSVPPIGNASDSEDPIHA